MVVGVEVVVVVLSVVIIIDVKGLFVVFIFGEGPNISTLGVFFITAVFGVKC